MTATSVLITIIAGIATSTAAIKLIDRVDDSLAKRDKVRMLNERIFRMELVHAQEILRIEYQRDQWKYMAGRLVHGAESQIDDLRGNKPPINQEWLAAWFEYEHFCVNPPTAPSTQLY